MFTSLDGDYLAACPKIESEPALRAKDRWLSYLRRFRSDAPAFPLATGALVPLRGAAEKRGSGDFSPLWAGEAAALGREESAETLARQLWADTVEIMSRLSLRTD